MSEALSAAIKHGVSVGLAQEELSKARHTYAELLKQARRKKARERLSAAADFQDMAMLKQAIEDARTSGMEDSEVSFAAAAYQKLHADKAQLMLQACARSLNPEAFEAALAEGGRIEEEEFWKVCQTLTSLQLLIVVERSANAAFQRNIDALQACIEQGVAFGIEEEELLVARAALDRAKQNIQEEHETNVMPCCGRASGGGRICTYCGWWLGEGGWWPPTATTAPSTSTTTTTATSASWPIFAKIDMQSSLGRVQE